MTSIVYVLQKLLSDIFLPLILHILISLAFFPFPSGYPLSHLSGGNCHSQQRQAGYRSCTLLQGSIELDTNERQIFLWRLHYQFQSSREVRIGIQLCCPRKAVKISRKKIKAPFLQLQNSPDRKQLLTNSHYCNGVSYTRNTGYVTVSKVYQDKISSRHTRGY